MNSTFEQKMNSDKITEKTKRLNSFKVFMLFVITAEDGECDASKILSKSCFSVWLNSRKKTPKCPDEAFRRALTAHCRGADGRRPFTAKVEKSLLKTLRHKQRWSCFDSYYEETYPKAVRDEIITDIGVQGFPSLGFHEQKEQKNQKCSTNKSTKQLENDKSISNKNKTKNREERLKIVEINFVESNLNKRSTTEVEDNKSQYKHKKFSKEINFCQVPATATTAATPNQNFYIPKGQNALRYHSFTPFYPIPQTPSFNNELSNNFYVPQYYQQLFGLSDYHVTQVHNFYEPQYIQPPRYQSSRNIPSENRAVSSNSSDIRPNKTQKTSRGLKTSKMSKTKETENHN